MRRAVAAGSDRCLELLCAIAMAVREVRIGKVGLRGEPRLRIRKAANRQGAREIYRDARICDTEQRSYPTAIEEWPRTVGEQPVQVSCLGAVAVTRHR